jgi:hypothetical protein
MTTPRIDHQTRVWQDGAGAAFAGCSCGWTGPGTADHPVPDDEPPFALAKAYNDAYGHTYRTRTLGLDA